MNQRMFSLQLLFCNKLRFFVLKKRINIKNDPELINIFTNNNLCYFRLSINQEI